MRILVDNGTYALENMGDVAMLQGCVTSLRGMWPDSRIGVFNRVPERLTRYCPEAEPVNALGRDQFVTPGAVLGKLHHVLPGLEEVLRRRAPGVAGRVVRARVRRRKLAEADVPGFVAALRSADLVVTSGGGYINDEFPWLAERILRTLRIAQGMGKRTAMLGQGLGPLTQPKLRALAADVLRNLDLLTLREGRANLPLLESLGVRMNGDAGDDDNAVVVTGDDAIELAHRHARTDGLGHGVGVNLRTTRYSGAGEDTIASLRPVLQSFAAARGAPLVPVPISFNDAGEDVRVLRALLGGEVVPDGVLPEPDDVMRAAASCRVVVTGAYHSAVFAMSGGVPAVALAASPYYVDKFEGLRAQFGGAGCSVVRFDSPGWAGQLRHEIERAWDTAATVRPQLLAAAARQVAAKRNAYARMTAWFPPRHAGAEAAPAATATATAGAGTATR